MKRPAISGRWMLVILCAAIGVGSGVALASALAPTDVQYRSTTNVAILPAPELSIADSSAFWEVLTRGQVNRTAAIVYNQPDRWLPAAAAVAGVPQSQLVLTAAAIPESTMVAVTVVGPSRSAADTALRDVLVQAGPQVAEVSMPFVTRVLDPGRDSATAISAPTRSQLVAAGAVGGAVTGLGLGLWIFRPPRRKQRPTQDVEDSEPL